MSVHDIRPPEVVVEPVGDPGGNVIEQGKAQRIVMPFAAPFVLVDAAGTIVERGAVYELERNVAIR